MGVIPCWLGLEFRLVMSTDRYWLRLDCSCKTNKGVLCELKSSNINNGIATKTTKILTQKQNFFYFQPLSDRSV